MFTNLAISILKKFHFSLDRLIQHIEICSDRLILYDPDTKEILKVGGN